MFVNENGCHQAGESTCADGTHTVLDFRQMDAQCGAITGIETIDIPGSCIGTYTITLTRQ
jgi:hypothetical protein